MPVEPSDSPRATTGGSERARLPSQSSAAYRDTGISIFALLVAFRALNALTLRTFFQPDEFFQSLEPAWQLAFGQESNAWLTWVGISFHCLELGLTSVAGVADPFAVVPASSHICNCLSDLCETGAGLWLEPAFSS